MDILNRQSSIPSELDETYGAPSDGMLLTRDMAPFSSKVKRLPRQTLMYSSSFFVGVEPRLMLGANQLRVYLTIQNLGPNNVYLGFGATPSITGNNALVITPGNGYAFENGICPNNEVIAVCSAETQVSIIEGLAAS